MVDLRGIEDSLAVEVLFDAGLKSKILAPLFAWAPLLAWGPLGFVVTQIVTFFAQKIFNAFKEFAGERFIAMARGGLLGQLDSVGSELAVIAIEKGIDSEEYKNARAAHKIALSKFARFGKP